MHKQVNTKFALKLNIGTTINAYTRTQFNNSNMWHF